MSKVTFLHYAVLEILIVKKGSPYWTWMFPCWYDPTENVGVTGIFSLQIAPALRRSTPECTFNIRSSSMQHPHLPPYVVLTKYDSPLLLHSFSLHVPARSTRAHPLIAVPRARVNTFKSGVFCRAPREMNEFLGDASVSADLFADSSHDFRNRVKIYVLAMNR